MKPNVDGAPIPNAGGASVDANVCGIVIGSTWRRCSASRAVAESSLAVADYLLGEYDNFLQFAGQKDGATRCAQIVQLLLANHVDHDVSDCSDNVLAIRKSARRHIVLGFGVFLFKKGHSTHAHAHNVKNAWNNEL